MPNFDFRVNFVNIRKIFVPECIFNNIYEISADSLLVSGKRGLVFDIDNTVAPYEVAKPTDEVKAYFSSLIANGFQIAFVSNNKIVTGKDVLLHFAKSRTLLTKYQTHQLSAVNESIFRFLETNELKSKEEESATKNVNGYISLLRDSGQREAIAHFSSFFEKGTYPKAIMFIMTKAPAVYQEIMKFISGI